MLQGLGLFVAFPSMLGRDPSEVAAKLVDLGASWVAGRGAVGADDATGNLWTDAHTAAAQAAGLRSLRWTYSRPSSWVREVELAKRWQGAGDDGFIIDAEVPWEASVVAPISAVAPMAAAYVDALRTGLGDAYFIADAPWPYPQLHGGFPFREFGARLDARLPQLYWTEINANGAGVHLALSGAAWTRYQRSVGEVTPVFPIGVTYGRRELAAWGAKQLPPGEIVASDVALFIERGASAFNDAPPDDPPVSLYSAEACAASVAELLRRYSSERAAARAARADEIRRELRGSEVPYAIPSAAAIAARIGADLAGPELADGSDFIAHRDAKEG